MSPLKKAILNGILSGIIFTTIMTAFDYFSKEPVLWYKIVVQFVVFGGIMTFFNWRAARKKEESTEND